MARARRGRGKAAGGKKKETPRRELPKKRVTSKPEEAVPAVCSECYGDFLISTSPSKDRITCPLCGHVGIIEEGIFEEIHRLKREERKNFILAAILTVGAFLAILLYGILNSWPFAAERTASGTIRFVSADETLNMALLGLGALFLIVGFVVIPRYERSRTEVYF